jgi:catechol 2,3-dioxygenase-like lactoylglutathione lyase family enzyme
MIDHVYISASDPARTVAFYAAALKPLGWREFASYDSATGPEGVPDLWGLIDGSGANTIWIRQRQPGETGLYIGFVANDPADASAAYAAALEAGGRDDGGPAPRPYFGEGYYAANVIDLDDNRLEFVHKSWNQRRHG